MKKGTYLVTVLACIFSSFALTGCNKEEPVSGSDSIEDTLKGAKAEGAKAPEGQAKGKLLKADDAKQGKNESKEGLGTD